MARARKSKKRRSWWLYLLATIVLAGILAWSWNWWVMRSWSPDNALYPDQGVAISDADGAVSFPTVRAIGGQFVYLHASQGAKGQDTRFGQAMLAAKKANLKVGAIHSFDPCTGADSQSANFVTMVPREGNLLPPAIALDQTAGDCPDKVSDAAVESELMTFINQVEMHTGKPVILKLSERFEQRYRISAQLERGLWLSRNRAQPSYAGRPWILWSANSGLVTEASEAPLEWVVVQP